MTRIQLLAAGDVFHLPGGHNQKSHGNRKGRESNVPTKSSGDSRSNDAPTKKTTPKKKPTTPAHEPEDDRADRDAEITRRFDNAAQGEDAFDALDFATRRDLINYVNTERDGEVDGVSGAEMRVAIDRYVGDEYTEVNGALRSGDGEQLTENDDTIRGVDAALSVSSTAADIITHRGISDATQLFGSAWDPNEDNTGLEWQDNAYVSTTTDPDVAQWFTQPGVGDFPNRVQMRVLVPRGTPAFTPRTSRDVDISGDELPEDEIVLGRELKYRVVRDYRERDSRGNETRKIDVEVVK